MTGALLPGKLREIRCQNVHAGRFVAIFFDHPGSLTVCEFEVYGGKFPTVLSENIKPHLIFHIQHAMWSSMV